MVLPNGATTLAHGRFILLLLQIWNEGMLFLHCILLLVKLYKQKVLKTKWLPDFFLELKDQKFLSYKNAMEDLWQIKQNAEKRSDSSLV